MTVGFFPPHVWTYKHFGLYMLSDDSLYKLPPFRPILTWFLFKWAKVVELTFAPFFVLTVFLNKAWLWLPQAWLAGRLLCSTLQLLILTSLHFPATPHRSINLCDPDTCGSGLSSNGIDLSFSYWPAASHDLCPLRVGPPAVWNSSSLTWPCLPHFGRCRWIAVCSGWLQDYIVVSILLAWTAALATELFCWLY